MIDMRSLFLIYFSIMASLHSNPSLAKFISSPRCLLLELNGKIQCWTNKNQKSIVAGSSLRFIGARPKAKGTVSASLIPAKKMIDPSNEIVLIPNQMFDIPSQSYEYTLTLKADHKVLLKIPLKIIDPIFQYALISINGKDEVIRDGSIVKLDKKSDFQIKEIRTNVSNGVSIMIEPKSAMFDELQVLYKEKVIGRAFIQMKGRL
jgi:hypothetical protein